MRRLATVPATLAAGTRTALAFVRKPSRGGLAVGGRGRLLGGQHRILWAASRPSTSTSRSAVVVQGFFVGMVANLIPFAPAGSGRWTPG